MNLQEGAVSFLKLTIPDGTKITEVLELDNGVYPVGFFHPILTTSIEVIFNVAMEKDGTLFPLHQDGIPLGITIDPTVAAYVPLIPIDFAGVKYIQIAIADNQAGGDDFYLAIRGV